MDEIYDHLTEGSSNFELEEIIKQHQDVAKINPHAINTVRVVTIVTTEDGKSILTIPKDERKKFKISNTCNMCIF